MHVHLHPQTQKMCGLHLGDESFYFSSLPFGIPTGQPLKNFLKGFFFKFFHSPQRLSRIEFRFNYTPPPTSRSELFIYR